MWVKVLSNHQPAFIAVLSFNLCILFYYICVYGIVQILYYSSLGYGDIESFCFYFMFPTDTFQFCNPLVWLLLLVVIVCSVFFLSSVLPVSFFSWCLVHCHWLWLFLILSICLYFILKGFFNLCLIPIDMKCIICFQDSALIKVKKTDDSIRSPSGVRRGPGRDHRPTFTQQ